MVDYGDYHCQYSRRAHGGIRCRRDEYLPAKCATCSVTCRNDRLHPRHPWLPTPVRRGAMPLG
nr:L103 [uncultured bacterium]